MKIDFATIEEKDNPGFKGGDGVVSIKAADDGKVRIMQMRVHPDSSIRLHRHVGNSEVIRVVNGRGHVIDDGGVEYDISEGSVTYCPDGKEHTIINTGNEDLVLHSIVSTSPAE